jgi:hypothetical protein
MTSKSKQCQQPPRRLSAAATRRKLLSRRDFLKRTALTGAALGTASTGLLNGAMAATKRLAVTTMPGPRWEGALRASAKAFEAKTPQSRDRDPRVTLCGALPADRNKPDQ